VIILIIGPENRDAMSFKISEKDAKQILKNRIYEMVSRGINHLVPAYVHANNYKSTEMVDIVNESGRILLTHKKSGASFAMTAVPTPNDKGAYKVYKTDSENVSTAGIILDMFPDLKNHLDKKVMPNAKSFAAREWKDSDDFERALDKVEDEARHYMLDMPEIKEHRKFLLLDDVI